MTKKLVIALLLLPLIGSAQSITGGGIASQFNNWRAYALTPVCLPPITVKATQP